MLATGGYGNVFYLSTNAKGSNVTAIWRAHKRGAYFGNPCYTQIHPTCIPVHGDYQSKLTLMSESLRNDGRVWVPKERGDERDPRQIPEDERDYYLERIYPAFGNLVPRDIASRQAKNMCDEGRGVGPERPGRLPRLRRRHRTGWAARPSRPSTATSSTCTPRSPARTPTRRRCGSTPPSTTRWAVCGSTTTCSPTIPGLFVIGEANFSDQGANRLGASALMQGLADGYFVLPATISDYLSQRPVPEGRRRPPGGGRGAAATCSRRSHKLLSINGTRSVGLLPPRARPADVGPVRHGALRGEPAQGAGPHPARSARSSGPTSRCSGDWHSFNQNLEHAGRVADFIELAELMCIDALHRSESCGGHFRAESQTPEGEALRDDENFAYVAAWEWTPDGQPPVLHREDLEYEYVHLAQRSYK